MMNTTLLLLAAVAAASEPVLHSRLTTPPRDFRPEALTADVRTLEDGKVYYLTNNLTFEGTAPGEPGLAVASNATVYICVPMEMTLTCRGADGLPATPGGGGNAPANTNTVRQSGGGYAFDYPTFNAPAGGAGGAGGTGGGAGILVPTGSVLVIYGNGKLLAQGGKGGDAAVGGQAAPGGHFLMSWRTQQGVAFAALTNQSYWTSVTGLAAPAGVGTGREGKSFGWLNGQPSSGGGGGGGAGGGGAAIGASGGDGAPGTDGGAHNELWDDHYGDGKDYSLPVVSAAKASETRAAPKAGKFYSMLSQITLTPGAGGAAMNEWDTVAPRTVATNFWYSNTRQVQCLYFGEGQPGGAGGAGGIGGKCEGGAGGAGGTGGDSGSLTCKLDDYMQTVTNDYLKPLPVRGDKGVPGDPGYGAPIPLVPHEIPYNTLTFDGTQTNEYVFNMAPPPRKVTIPASGAAWPYLCAWEVVTPAVTASGLRNDSEDFLASQVAYWPGSEGTVGRAAYGDILLTPTKLPQVDCNGTMCGIRIRTGSEFYKKYLEPIGSAGSFAGVEAFLNAGGPNRFLHWQDYVLGIDTNELVGTAIGASATNRAVLTVRPIVLKPSVRALDPVTDAGIDSFFRLYRADSLSAPVTWRDAGEICPGEEYAVDPAGRPAGFFKGETSFKAEKK